MSEHMTLIKENFGVKRLEAKLGLDDGWKKTYFPPH